MYAMEEIYILLFANSIANATLSISAPTIKIFPPSKPAPTPKTSPPIKATLILPEYTSVIKTKVANK